jgi:hypothetical protein
VSEPAASESNMMQGQLADASSPVAQLGEQLPLKQELDGATPSGAAISF